MCAVVRERASPCPRSARLDKETVTDEETVSGEVRQERIEVDDESGTSR